MSQKIKSQKEIRKFSKLNVNRTYKTWDAAEAVPKRICIGLKYLYYKLKKI